jgi:hypothetical protein
VLDWKQHVGHDGLMAQTKQQKREKQTEYRERQQLKVAREVISGKRDGAGRKINTDSLPMTHGNWVEVDRDTKIDMGRAGYLIQSVNYGQRFMVLAEDLKKFRG